MLYVLIYSSYMHLCRRCIYRPIDTRRDSCLIGLDTYKGPYVHIYLH